MSTEELVSRQVLENFIANELHFNQAFFARIFEYYKEDIRDLKKSNLDIQTLGLLAHKIKSSSQAFGTTKLAGLLQQIEIHTKNGKHAAIEPVLQEVLKCVDPTLDLIQAMAGEIFLKIKKYA